MPTVGSMFPSPWYKAEDLRSPTGKGFREVELTIRNLSLEEIGGGEDQPKEKKWAVHFTSGDKSLILNKTNAETIADALGEDTDDWISNKIVLFVMTVGTPTGPKPGIRVRVPVQEARFDPDKVPA